MEREEKRKQHHHNASTIYCWDIYSALHCSCVLCILNCAHIEINSLTLPLLWEMDNSKANVTRRRLMRAYYNETNKQMSKYRLQRNSCVCSVRSQWKGTRVKWQSRCLKISTMATFNIFIPLCYCVCCDVPSEFHVLFAVRVIDKEQQQQRWRRQQAALTDTQERN